jgi:ribonuclease P protein component
VSDARQSTAVRDPEGSPSGYRMPRASRIRKTRDIRTILRRGKRRRTAHLDVFLSSSPVSRCRWGLIVPKHRHTIVERNRLKRRLREVGRTEVLPRLWREGLAVDVLVRARREAYGAGFRELRDELLAMTEGLCSQG